MLLRQGPGSANNPERRALRRFSMKLPASVRVAGIPSEFPTETQNVSARGIFFHLERWLSDGARVEVTISFPVQVTITNPVRVRFIARVVRVEPTGQGMRMGVAAVIEEYEFIQSRNESAEYVGMQPGLGFTS
jgi:PilZ domain